MTRTKDKAREITFHLDELLESRGSTNRKAQRFEQMTSWIRYR